MEAAQRLPEGGAPSQVLHRARGRMGALIRFGQTTIRNKIIHGTGEILINRPYTELCDEIRALPLPRDVLEDWLCRNAVALLQLDQ